MERVRATRGQRGDADIVAPGSLPGDCAGLCRRKRLSGRFSSAKGGQMAKGQKKSNKEVRKPKAEKPKTNASQPSQKGLIAGSRD